MTAKYSVVQISDGYLNYGNNYKGDFYDELTKFNTLDECNDFILKNENKRMMILENIFDENGELYKSVFFSEI